MPFSIASSGNQRCAQRFFDDEVSIVALALCESLVDDKFYCPIGFGLSKEMELRPTPNPEENEVKMAKHAYIQSYRRAVTSYHHVLRAEGDTPRVTPGDTPREGVSGGMTAVFPVLIYGCRQDSIHFLYMISFLFLLRIRQIIMDIWSGASRSRLEKCRTAKSLWMKISELMGGSENAGICCQSEDEAYVGVLTSEDEGKDLLNNIRAPVSVSETEEASEESSSDEDDTMVTGSSDNISEEQVTSSSCPVSLEISEDRN
ncbi:hypothetical protein KSP40_PGU000003 [Platanthera guangdongensis]|uniref:Uncharacterized protein n=1 Tax=Platanthera guangdongensis TaxID=2320717 RepID=A0ABR2LTQ8_9ASPA